MPNWIPKALGKRRMNTNTLLAASMVVLLSLGVGIGWGFGTTVSPMSKVSVTVTSGSSSSNSSQPYALTLVEIMENFWNSTSESQPAFFVLGSHGLESSANLTLPANRLIKLTIMSYDTPTENTTAGESMVNGTVGGNMYLINGTLASGMSMDNATMMENWGQNVTSVPYSTLAHTFTIQQLGINIPVVGGSTVIAYLRFTHPGTYVWICLTVCGLGNNGLAGAMEKPGWMTGTLTVK